MSAPVQQTSIVTIPVVYARQLHTLLQQAEPEGVKAMETARVNWTSLLDAHQHLSIETVIQLVSSAISLTRKPWLGLDLAASFPVMAHGPQAYAMVTACDLGGSLAVLAKYGALRNEVANWSLRSSEQGARVHGTSNHDWGPASGFILDMLLGAILSLIENALGHLPAGLTVDMPMPCPRWIQEYNRFEPVRFRFDQPVLAFHASHSLLRLPCLAADNHAHAAALRECESSLAQADGRLLSERVRRLLAAPQGGRYPQLDEVAAQCKLTQRTLMRHLQAEGTSFKTLLDASRQNKAIWMLQQTTRSVEDIAAQLGYKDTSNFSRTVRRWFGASPRQLRQSHATCSKSP